VEKIHKKPSFRQRLDSQAKYMEGQKMFSVIL